MDDRRNAYRYENWGDHRLAELADRQHGMVASRQLQVMGYTRPAIARRAHAGRLHRVHRGVYAVGHRRISLRGRWMAAVLACGPAAVLSHRSAAALWDLRPTPSGPIDVIVPGVRRIPGIRAHETALLHESDRTEIDGIPVTSLARTLLDEASQLGEPRLRSVLEAAERRELLDLRAIEDVLRRFDRHPGAKPLQAGLALLSDDPPWLQSDRERDFLELVRDAGLPEPSCNVVLEGEPVDFFWPRHRLVVEVDGYGYHRSKRSFEDDRLRDTKLQLAGIRVVRITRDRLKYEPAAVLDDVRRLLGL